jgi:hypothetical protein
MLVLPQGRNPPAAAAAAARAAQSAAPASTPPLLRPTPRRLPRRCRCALNPPCSPRIAAAPCLLQCCKLGGGQVGGTGAAQVIGSAPSFFGRICLVPVWQRLQMHKPAWRFVWLWPGPCEAAWSRARSNAADAWPEPYNLVTVQPGPLLPKSSPPPAQWQEPAEGESSESGRVSSPPSASCRVGPYCHVATWQSRLQAPVQCKQACCRTPRISVMSIRVAAGATGAGRGPGAGAG